MYGKPVPLLALTFATQAYTTVVHCFPGMQASISFVPIARRLLHKGCSVHAYFPTRPKTLIKVVQLF